MTEYQVFSAGSNARGQLAIGSENDAHTFAHCIFDTVHGPTSQSPGRILQLACGANHTLLLLQSSGPQSVEVWGCGDGSKGQLGPDFPQDGSTTFRRIDMSLRPDLEKQGLGAYTTVKMIAAGWETSYIVFERPGHDDILVSMGANDFGTLGIGKGKSPVGSIHVVHLRGLYSDAVGLGSDQAHILKFESLNAGPHHVVVRVCSLSDSGPSKVVLTGWGTSRHGQLGPSFQSLSSGKYEGFRPLPHIIDSDAGNVVACALGNQHTVFLDRRGTLVGLGSNRKTQLSGIESWGNVTVVGCTWNGTYSIVLSPSQRHANFSILATGSNDKGQLGISEHLNESTTSAFTVAFPFGPGTYRLVKMACGSEHVLCLFSVHDIVANVCDERSGSADGLKERSEVWAWGWNEHGNLGTGDTADVRSPRRIWPDEGEFGIAIDIWAGCGTSWILVER